LWYLSVIVTKHLKKINLNKERFILGYGITGFSPWSLGSIVSGPVVRQSIMVERVWQSKAAHFETVGSRERKGVGTRHTLQIQGPMTLFLQPVPNS
jgi:hypothetical protein